MTLALTVTACSDTGPSDDVDFFPGRWYLETVNGVPLPTRGTVIAQGVDLVRAGRLTIRAPGEGFPIWEFCTEDAEDGSLTFHGGQEVRYAPGTSRDVAELVYLFPLFTVTDTLRLQGGVLTLAFNWNSDDEPPDLLRFRRLEEGEHEEPVCQLALR